MPKRKTAMELAVAMAEETVNHLHDRQDYDRIKDMARELLKAAGKEAKKGKKSSITRDQLPQKLIEGMIDAEFNAGTWADGYTFMAWRRDYGQEMIDAVVRLVIQPMKAERKAAEEQLANITKKYVGAA